MASSNKKRTASVSANGPVAKKAKTELYTTAKLRAAAKCGQWSFYLIGLAEDVAPPVLARRLYTNVERDLTARVLNALVALRRRPDTDPARFGETVQWLTMGAAYVQHASGIAPYASAFDGMDAHTLDWVAEDADVLFDSVTDAVGFLVYNACY